MNKKWFSLLVCIIFIITSSSGLTLGELHNTNKINNLKEQVRNSDIIRIDIAENKFMLLLLASQRQREILLEGGLLNYTKNRIN